MFSPLARVQPGPKRRRTFLFTTMLAAGFALFHVAADAATATRVRLGTVAWIGYAPFYVAVAKDLFAKYGVKVELQDFPDPATMPAAVKSGGLQGGMYTYDLVITAVAQDQKLRVVMPIDYSNGADAIVGEKSMTSIADLKGRKVAYPFATCDNLSTLR